MMDILTRGKLGIIATENEFVIVSGEKIYGPHKISEMHEVIHAIRETGKIARWEVRKSIFSLYKEAI